MYQKNVPEKLIMERSGHLSRAGVMSYEHTTPGQEKAVCRTLGSEPEQPLCTTNTSLPKPPLDMLDSYLGIHTTATSSIQVKQEDNTRALDMMQKMQFNNMTNCTLNITFKP